ACARVFQSALHFAPASAADERFDAPRSARLSVTRASPRNPLMPAIVALGEPMIEFNQARAEAPEQYLRGFGGDTSNMAIAAARLVGDAGRVGYVTRVGDDAFGRMLIDLWHAEGVDTAGVAVDQGA